METNAGISLLLLFIDEGFYLWIGGDETELIETVYDLMLVLPVKVIKVTFVFDFFAILDIRNPICAAPYGSNEIHMA